MQPIEIEIKRYGYDILTGTVETDLTGKNIIEIIVRSPGATLAKLEVGVVDLLTTRPGLSVALNSQDTPIMAGYDLGERRTKFFTKIQLTNAADSVSLIAGETIDGEW